MSAPFFLGVDGGGTKTEFLCIDSEGRELARARTETTYHLQVGLDGAVDALARGIGEVCGQLSVTPGDLTFAFIGLPAFGEDPAIDPQLEAACGRLLGHSRYSCANDMVCGWAGSLGCKDGINLVAGTGSIAYGRRDGREARTGGWGELFGDEGSAHWIAIRGLNAFTQMSDGRLPRGPLYDCFRETLSLSSDLDICAKLLGTDGPGRDGIAALAHVVTKAADLGDEIASAILSGAAEELVSLATALRTELGFAVDEPCALSWSGGVLLRQPLVQRRFRDRVESDERFKVTEPRWSPVLGAAHLARQLSAGR